MGLPSDAPTRSPTVPGFSPTGRPLLSPKGSRVVAIGCVAVVGAFEALALSGYEWAHGPAVFFAGLCGVISPGWRQGQ